MNVMLSIAGWFSFAFAVIAASAVVVRSPRSALHRSLALFLLFGALWGLIISFQSPEATNDFNLWVIRLTFVSATGMCYALLLFMFALTKSALTLRRHAVLIIIYGTMLALTLSPLVIESVHIAGGAVVPARKEFYLPVILTILATAVVAISMVVRLYRQTTNIHERQRYGVILVGLVAGVTSAISTNVVLPNALGTTLPSSFAWIATIIWTVILVYAVVKHGFLDIRLAVVRTLAYIGVLATLSMVYYLFAYFLSIFVLKSQVTDIISISPLNITLALILAFLFQPIKKFFDRITNRIFYRDNYKTEEFFAELSQLLASTTELRGLLQRAAAHIATTLKAEQAFFFLYYTNATHHHISAGTERHSRLPVYDVHMLDAYTIDREETLIITDELPEDLGVRRMLVSHKVELVMVLRRTEGVIGYLCLGEQQGRGRGFTRRDFQVLRTVADELVIAIQNALSLHEIKEINATLQQRIDSATKELRSSNAQLRHLDEVKDEFMSMASHQLRTPLTSVKGYISMVIEGDTGDISPQQRRVLEEAFNSSERMVRLIADFLNVSRLQTGKFMIEKMPTNLVKVVQDEVASLKIIAKTHDMKLAFEMPDKPLPEINIDEAKIRQVIMNFIDNAIYYSKPKTTVRVVLEQIEDDIAFRVIDTGIGVPLEEQPKLFNKFFRAKNARKQRPDGTGVGLYLAKKVVTAHKGKMIFSSEEGKGSTFGFRIPINQTQ